MKYRLAIIAPSPIQYHAPLFRQLAQHASIDLMVYYCSDYGVTEKVDTGFGVAFKWDMPLLEGYKYKFLTNFAPKQGYSFFNYTNPGIIRELWVGHYDAVLIDGYTSFSNMLTFLTAWLKGTPILFLGESQLLRKRSFLKRVLKKLLLVPLFRTINGFLAIGTLNKEYYLHYSVPEEKIFHVPYTVDEFFFKKQKEKVGNNNVVREELGIQKDSIVILYVGKIFGVKGPGAFDLLKAFEKLGDNCAANLVFVGEGKERCILEEYIENRRLRNVFFTGFKNQTELPEYYNLADVLVLPSYTEQWGIVINEAMYFDTAIIASDQVGAAYDLVRNEKNGYIFPAGDIDNLADCLRKVVNDRELLQSMKVESERVISNWNLDVCVYGVLTALNYLKRT